MLLWAISSLRRLCFDLIIFWAQGPKRLSEPTPRLATLSSNKFFSQLPLGPAPAQGLHHTAGPATRSQSPRPKLPKGLLAKRPNLHWLARRFGSRLESVGISIDRHLVDKFRNIVLLAENRTELHMVSYAGYSKLESTESSARHLIQNLVSHGISQPLNSLVLIQLIHWLCIGMENKMVL